MRKSIRLALINSAIAGGLVFAGSFADGQVTATGIIAALSASLVVFLTKLREYFSLSRHKKAMKGALFEFI